MKYNYNYNFIIAFILLILSVCFPTVLLKNSLNFSIISSNQANEYYPFPKKIWAYWSKQKPMTQIQILFLKQFQEFMNKQKIQGWDYTILNDQNIPQYLPNNIEQFYKAIQKKNLNIIPANKADMVRLFILEQHGGVYIDLTSLYVEDLTWISLNQLINNPHVINKNLQSSGQPNILLFYAPFHQSRIYYTDKQGNIHNDFPGYQSWFIAAKKNSQFIKDWKNKWIQFYDINQEQAFNQLKKQDIFYGDFFIQSYHNVYWALYYVIQSKQKQLDKNITLFQKRITSNQYYKIWSINCEYGPCMNYGQFMKIQKYQKYFFMKKIPQLTNLYSLPQIRYFAKFTRFHVDNIMYQFKQLTDKNNLNKSLIQFYESKQSSVPYCYNIYFFNEDSFIFQYLFKSTYSKEYLQKQNLKNINQIQNKFSTQLRYFSSKQVVEFYEYCKNKSLMQYYSYIQDQIRDWIFSIQWIKFTDYVIIFIYASYFILLKIKTVYYQIYRKQINKKNNGNENQKVVLNQEYNKQNNQKLKIGQKTQQETILKQYLSYEKVFLGLFHFFIKQFEKYPFKFAIYRDLQILNFIITICYFVILQKYAQKQAFLKVLFIFLALMFNRSLQKKIFKDINKKWKDNKQKRKILMYFHNLLKKINDLLFIKIMLDLVLYQPNYVYFLTFWLGFFILPVIQQFSRAQRLLYNFCRYQTYYKKIKQIYFYFILILLGSFSLFNNLKYIMFKDQYLKIQILKLTIIYGIFIFSLIILKQTIDYLKKQTIQESNSIEQNVQNSYFYYTKKILFNYWIALVFALFIHQYWFTFQTWQLIRQRLIFVFVCLFAYSSAHKNSYTLISNKNGKISQDKIFSTFSIVITIILLVLILLKGKLKEFEQFQQNYFFKNLNKLIFFATIVNICCQLYKRKKF